MHCGLASSDKENSRTHEIVFSLHKEKIFHNMLKREVFDLESINDVGVVMVFSVQKLSLFVFHNCEYIIILHV